MLRQNEVQKLHHCVERAADEFGTHGRLKLLCKCLLLENKHVKGKPQKGVRASVVEELVEVSSS